MVKTEIGGDLIDVHRFRQLISESGQVGDLLGELAPPHHFAHARFENYLPDPDFPSQGRALEEIRGFTDSLGKSSFRLSKLFRSKRSPGSGLYLDGGFGIGKTHLLASAYHSAKGPKAYLTFQELMFLVGLQGLSKTAKTFGGYTLLVIDEFELDDPANTRIATNLLGQLFEAGVSIISSSNTSPGALGEGKFSVESFQRELGRLFTQFTTIRIEGEDYRVNHRSAKREAVTWTVGKEQPVPAMTGTVLSIGFADLLSTLALAHPIRIRKALHTISGIYLDGVDQIDDPHAALRFVYLIDKAYDDDLEFAARSNVEISDLFARSIYHGGDTKKYLRTMSRLEEMTQT